MKTFLKIVITTFAFCTAPLSFSSSLINGVAVHSELGQESFIGALFTENLSNDGETILSAQEDKQIQVRVVARRISARRFKRMWIDGMAINAQSSELQSQSRNMADFSNMLKVSLKAGDIFAIQRENDTVKVIINGSTLGEIEDPAFFDLLLRTWIGSVPLSSQFRENLLAAGETDAALQDRFNGIRPSNDRITAIAAALEGAANKTPEPQGNTPAVSAPSIAAPVVAAPTIKAPIVTAPTLAPQAPAAPVQEPTPEPQEAIAEASDGIEQAPSETPDSEQAAPEQLADSSTDTNAQDGSDLALNEDGLSNEGDQEVILEEDEDEFTAESLLARQLYVAKLRRWTNKELKYPTRSLDKNEEGTVRISVTIDRDGDVQNVEILEAPKYSRLTKAAIKAVKKSSPYPAVPETITDESFLFTLPIAFQIIDNG